MRFREQSELRYKLVSVTALSTGGRELVRRSINECSLYDNYGNLYLRVKRIRVSLGQSLRIPGQARFVNDLMITLGLRSKGQAK